MQIFRKRPVEIEAVQWEGTPEGATVIINWILGEGGTARFHEARPPRLHDEACRCDGMGVIPGMLGKAVACPETEPQGETVPATIAIDTLEGTMKCREHSWVIKGVAGEFYACLPAIFDETYEAV